MSELPESPGQSLRHNSGTPQGEQLAILVVQVDPVLTPVLAVRDELEVPAGQRMEQVGYPHTPGPRSPTGCSSSANGICGRSWLSMSPITTAGDLIAAGSSARPGPTTLSRTSPRSGSSDSLSSAASSTSTSELHRSPGQDRRPSSGTPQVRRSARLCRRVGVRADVPDGYVNLWRARAWTRGPSTQTSSSSAVSFFSARI